MKSYLASHPRFIAGAAVLLFVVAVTVSAADAPIWSVRGSAASGSSVNVSLTNVGSQTSSGCVHVQAVVANTPIWSSAPACAKPGQTVTVSVPFPGKVQSALSVAISDDATPF